MLIKRHHFDSGGVYLYLPNDLEDRLIRVSQMLKIPKLSPTSEYLIQKDLGRIVPFKDTHPEIYSGLAEVYKNLSLVLKRNLVIDDSELNNVLDKVLPKNRLLPCARSGHIPNLTLAHTTRGTHFKAVCRCDKHKRDYEPWDLTPYEAEQRWNKNQKGDS